MAVTAVQDGQKCVHPTAISGFAASEGELSSESHTLAEKTLNPQKSFAGHLCIVDGAPCLAQAALNHYEGITIAGCRRHAPGLIFPPIVLHSQVGGAETSVLR